MPGALRVSLWNIIEPWIWEQHYGDEYVRRARWVYNFPAIQWPTDEVPLVNTSVATQRLKQWLTTTAIWHQVYDFVEALPEMIAYGMRSRLDDLNELKARSINMYDHVVRLIDNYSADLNAMLEREGAPYQYRKLLLVPITSPAELEELARAMTDTPFQGARMHITDAAAKLAQRPDPDFRNSIKEAVCAVESLLQEATGLKGERLPKLLDAFEAKYGVDLHGAFKSALGSLYGWTSDDGGIRHGIFGNETVSRAEAQFMLVACSALCNFLVANPYARPTASSTVTAS